MLVKKRRSFSRKFSSSFAGDITGGNSPTQLLTPSNDSLHRGTGLAATPQHRQQAPHSPPPVVIVPKKAEMAPPSKEDVLSPKHAERVLVVGKGVVLTANVTSCDKVIVEGQFQGNIKTDTFVLTEGGDMEGEVRCSDGCIGGNMKATLSASKTILIGKAAVVTGDVTYSSLQVMDGARLQGKLTHYAAPPQKEPKPAAAVKKEPMPVVKQEPEPIVERELKPVVEKAGGA